VLRSLLQGKRYEAEQHRQERLVVELRRSRATPLRFAAGPDKIEVANLPPGVALTPGKIEVIFLDIQGGSRAPLGPCQSPGERPRGFREGGRPVENLRVDWINTPAFSADRLRAARKSTGQARAPTSRNLNPPVLTRVPRTRTSFYRRRCSLALRVSSSALGDGGSHQSPSTAKISMRSELDLTMAYAWRA
jgi:hypothetical protein